jgi:phage tail sheath protein FI
VVERTHLGVVALSADTLCDDAELRPVPVRRLLHLLRRLAAREGQQYAFEPNGEGLQGAARRGFEGVLADLFAAGALAGRRPEQAFRVAVSAPAGRDGAQLVVELRVAPSLPLRFLTVRLVRAADGRLQVEPAA